MHSSSLRRRFSAHTVSHLLLQFMAITLLLTLFPAPLARAASTLLVSQSGADSGDCIAVACLSIGFAINKASAGDTISIGPGTYAGNLVIDKDLTLTNEHRDAIVDGGNTTRVLTISSAASVTMLNVAIRNGRAPDSGGGIANAGFLSLHGVSISGNTAASGAGISNSGTLRIFSSTISGNTASSGAGPSHGGGIENSGDLALFASEISANSASGTIESLGGAIYSCATLTIADTTISTNTAPGSAGAGGGLYECGHADITSSTFSDNTSGVEGGGIANAGFMTLTNSTISGNRVSTTNGGSSGGGIWNASGDLTIRNSTITGNSASVGGGIAHIDRRLSLANTIVAGNSAGTGPDCSGPLTSQGHNLIGDVGGCGVARAAGDQRGTRGAPIDPQLSPLQNNGGLTFTQKPLLGSAAMNAGAACAAADQRGTLRPQGASCDIGAYESGVIDWFVSPQPLGNNANSCQSQAQPCETIAGAMVKATHGEQIHIAAGRYIEGLPIAENLTFLGAGRDRTIIDGNQIGAMLVTVAGISAKIDGVTLQNGNGTPGGAVVNNGILALSNSAVSGNSSQGSGGGIFNTGTLTVTNSIISNNTSGTAGGGIFNSGGTVALQGSTVLHNTATGLAGGGIYNSGGTVTLTGSDVVSNTLVGISRIDSGGGGIYSSGGTVALTNGTVRNNHVSAFGHGAGIDVITATLTMNGTRVDSNSTATGDAGGIFAYTSTLALDNSTISNNTGLFGGGIEVYHSGSSVTLNNSHVIGNTAANAGGGISNAGGVLLVQGNSTINDNVANGPGDGGGGIWNAGDTSVINSTISGNSAPQGTGGGIDNTQGAGTLILNATTVSNNTSSRFGGGMYSIGGTVTLNNSSVSGNTATVLGAHGGGLYLDTVTLAMTGTTVDGNHTVLGDGGGIFGIRGTLVLTDSTISHNTALRGDGGGIAVVTGSRLSISGGRISNNQAAGVGGGISGRDTSSIALSNRAEINDNIAAGSGGGIYNAATLQLTNTVVSGNLVDSVAANANGGGIANVGQATITATQVLRNRATTSASGFASNGAGIINQGGVLTTINSSISNNVLEASGGAHIGAGGGIFSLQGQPLTLRGSTISGNQGAGVYIDAGGAATLADVTIKDNHAPSDGGGIFIGTNTTAQITRATIQQNTSAGQGGGVAINSNVIATLTDVTISDNQSAAAAGGVYIAASNLPTATVSMTRAIIQENHGISSGGGIATQGRLIIVDSQIITNTARTPQPPADNQIVTVNGGGIDNSGILTIDNSSISGNRLENPLGDGIWGVGDPAIPEAREWGGGIASEAGSTLILNNTIISGHHVGGNPALSYGGGLYLLGETAALTNVRISDNEVLGNGGGIYVQGTALTITGSTISDNHATFANLPNNASCIPQISLNCHYNEGGGIDINSSGTLSITNSTLSGNRSDNIAGALFLQGDRINARLDHVTMTDNSADQGGGIWHANASIPLHVQGSIIAGNTSRNGISLADCQGGLTSDGYNLFGIAGECDPIGIDLSGTESHPLDPHLGQLQLNGGSTSTHALLPGSPAIDADNSTSCPPTDQRGAARPWDGDGNGTPVCDIGAVEATAIISDSGLLPEETWQFQNPQGSLDEYGKDFVKLFGEPTISRIETITNTETITAAGQLNLPFGLQAEDIRAAIPLSITTPLSFTGTVRRNPIAQMLYTTIMKETFASANVQWAGSALKAGLCVGMTSTVADFKATGLDPHTFGGPPVHAITQTNEVQSLLQQYHMRQLSAEALGYEAGPGRHDNAKQYFDDFSIRTAASGWWKNPEIIGLVNHEGQANQTCQDAKVGHALLPRMLVRDDSSRLYRIYVYDPNYPPDTNGNAVDRYIDIAQDSDGIWHWSYQLELPTPGHAGVKWSGVTLYSLPLDTLRHRDGSPLTLPTEDGQGVVVVNGGQKGAWGGQKGAWGGQKGAWGELGDGQKIGCILAPDGSGFFFTREISRSLRLFALDGPALYIPTSEISRTGSLTFNSHGGDVSDILIFGKHTVIGYLGTANDKTEDRLTVDAGLTTTALHTTDQRNGKQVTIYQMHEGERGADGTSETRVVAVSNANLGASDALTMTVSKDSHDNLTSVTLVNRSTTPNSGDIGFASVGSNGISTIVYFQQPIGAGERREYIPSNWQNLETMTVTVKIYASGNISGQPDRSEIIQPAAHGSTPVLDSFDRPSGRLGSSWAHNTDLDAYRISQHRVRVQQGGTLYWKPAVFGPTQEVFVTLTHIGPRRGRIALLLKVQGATPSISNGALEIRYDRQIRQVRLLTRLPGRTSPVIIRFPATFVDGDRFGARALPDGTVQVYRNTILIGEAHVDPFFLNRNGRIGLRYLDSDGAVFDDFGGGTISP